MHQISFGGRALPGSAGGAYSTPPDPLAGLRGPTSKGRGRRGRGRGRGGGKGGEGRGGEREGRGEEGRDLEVPPPSQLSGSAYALQCSMGRDLQLLKPLVFYDLSGKFVNVYRDVGVI